MEDVPLPSNEYHEYLDPDDVGLHRSPLLKPVKINLQPSPSPPPTVPDPPDHKDSQAKYHPSQGDAVIVSFMAGGQHSDIARAAGDKPLASDTEEGEEPVKGTEVAIMVVEEEEEGQEEVVEDEAIPEKNGFDLAALAADALRQTAKVSSELAQKEASAASSIPKLSTSCAGDPMEALMPTTPSISTLYADKSGSQSSLDAAIKHEMSGSPAVGELPPIRQHSPQSALLKENGTGHVTLPSISEQLGDINHLTAAAAAEDSAASKFPPSRPPPRFSAVLGDTSLGKLPKKTFRRELPSLGRGHLDFNVKSHRKLSQTDELQHSSTSDYCASDPETPITDQSGSTPAAMAIDRMSIDGITNPQIRAFQCTYPGCIAQPFQTQYLLNSHANVHSSNRPHYCSVKGCPRSEGGKGFKRKNEMIRHGLVHDSPGYVCPFCPDREHKYPRPDNLQRHVRVHHVDKDKDDPQLREVLSQRPEGPGRGRRRRGGTS